MKSLVTITLLFITGIAQAQINGKVIDSETNEPIHGAVIYGLDTTATNKNGTFTVRTENQIKVSSLGYETITLKVKEAYILVKLKPDFQGLGEVVITAFNANRKSLTVPAAVSVLTNKELSRGDNASIIPVLNGIPGVKLDYKSYGNYRLNIRGGALAQPSVHSSGYRMYWNGIPVSGGIGGLDVNFIKQMEIIKGPGSSLYGAGLGGVVLVESAGATGGGTVISTDNMYGGYHTFRSSTGAKTSWESGNIAFRYTHTQSDGYRDMTGTNQNVYNLFGQIYTGDKGTLNYLIDYENRDITIAGELDLETYKNAPKTARTISPTHFGPDKIGVGASYQYIFNDHWRANTGVNYTNNKGVFVMSYPYFAVFDKEPSSGLNTRTTVTYNTYFGETSFKVDAGLETGLSQAKGISYDGAFELPNSEITNVNKAKINLYLGFLQAEFHFPFDVYLTAGLSYNDYHFDVRSGAQSTDPLIYKTDVNHISPRIALLKKFGNYSVYASASNGFSPPTGGISNDFLNFDGTINEGLKPSSGWNYEIGTKGRAENGFLFYDAAAYYMKVKDAIITRLDEVSPGVNVERKTNAGSVNQAGIELLAGLNFTTDQTGLLYGSKLSVGYTYNDYQYDEYKTFIVQTDPDTNEDVYIPVDYSGKEVPGTFQHSFNVMLDIQTKYGLYLNNSFKYFSDVYLSNENNLKTEPYSLLDLKLGYRLPLLKGKLITNPYFGVNNLTNTLYSSLTAYNSPSGQYYYPGYRRQFFGGINLSFKP